MVLFVNAATAAASADFVLAVSSFSINISECTRYIFHSGELVLCTTV